MKTNKIAIAAFLALFIAFTTYAQDYDYSTALELELMKGFPPSVDKRVDKTNALFTPPYNRWSYLNMRTSIPLPA